MVKTENKINKEESNSKPMQASSNDKKKKYKGVRMRSWGSWVSEIRAPNQKTRIWLGSYSTAEAAARAYDAALLCLKGSSANLNFPLTSSQFIPQDTSVMSPKSIQRVAAAAANSFVDENNSNNNNAICTPPPPPASTSSSLVSSPSFNDDDVSVSLFSSFGGCDQVNESMAMMDDSWYGFDQMLSGALLDIDSTQMLDDCYEDGGDISLWSYC